MAWLTSARDSALSSAHTSLLGSVTAACRSACMRSSSGMPAGEAARRAPAWLPVFRWRHTFEDERNRRRINVEQHYAGLAKRVSGLYPAPTINGRAKLIVDRHI